MGKEVGLDLYKKVEKGMVSLNTTLESRLLKGSGKAINEQLGAVCKTSSGEATLCLDGQDFTSEQLALIANGQLGAISLHIKGGVSSFDTDTLLAIQSKLKKYADDMKSTIKQDQETLTRLMSTNLYADGDTNNSSYDILYDMERINRVIFSQEINYQGVVNREADALDLFSAGEYDTTEESGTGDDTGTGTGRTSTGTWRDTDVGTGTTATGTTTTGTGTTPTTSTGSVMCATDTSITSLEVVTPVIDLVSTTGTLTSTGTLSGTTLSGTTSSGGTTASGAADYWNGRPPSPFLGGRGDSPYGNPEGCNGVICIVIEFIRYNQLLLNYGGKTSSIEAIVDQNLKIADKNANKSFAQAKMTKNFFELHLLDLDLSEMFHISAQVSTMPTPLLDKMEWGKRSSGEKDTAGAGSAITDEDWNKKVQDTLTNTFKTYDLVYGSQNLLDDGCNDLALSRLSGQTTDALGNITLYVRCMPLPAVRFDSVQLDAIRGQYEESFFRDLLSLSSFTSGFQTAIEGINSVIQAMHAKPTRTN